MKALLILIAAALSYPISDAARWTAEINRCTSSRRIYGGYWPSWVTLPASDINTTYLSHVYYAFITMDSTTFELVVPPSDDQKIGELTTALRGKAKILISIGGGGSNSTAFSVMAANVANRATFINSTVDIARKYNIDGYDLDWEFPDNQADMDNLGVLFREWKTALVADASTSGRCPYIITAAVYFASHRFFQLNQTYPAAAIRTHVDWINAMFYDYRGSWDTSLTGAHTAVFDPASRVSTDFGVRSWVNAGVPRAKIMMGLALYGRTWRLADPESNGIGSPAVGVGPGSSDGTMRYNKIVDFNSANGATVRYNASMVSTYSYVNTSWISYDDEVSVRGKIEYAKIQSLGGHFFWAVGYDKNWFLTEQAARAWKN